MLTLHFTLPFKTPVKAKDLQIEIYDPTYFVDFELAKDKPATLSARRQAASCRPEPREMTFEEGKRLAQNPPKRADNWGASSPTRSW